MNRRRLELLQSMREIRWMWYGVVAIDDTLLPKTGRKIPGAVKLWDHNSVSYVHAQYLVTSHYVDTDRDYPTGLRQYYKHDSQEAERYRFKTKLELAMELVDEYEMLGVAEENYVFDSWYLSWELAGHIEAHRKGWVSRLKSNRSVYHRKRRISINEFEKAMPKESFRMVKALGKSH